MKKIITALLSVALISITIQPVKADTAKTVVIIDSAIDSKKVPNIVYEACFTTEQSGPRINGGTGKVEYIAEGCANGLTQQEGVGSASASDYSIRGIDHGWSVAQSALLANPNVKIIFIRISDIKKYPTFSMIRNDEKSLDSAISWVSNNASKFNIGAVSISQSRSNFAAGTCPNNLSFSNSVKSLTTQNVPVFVATGNDSKKNMVGYPACVQGVIAVGALVPTVNKRPYLASYYTEIARYTNVGPELDIVARGDADIKAYCGCKDITVVGTSIATPFAASIIVGNMGSMKLDALLAMFGKVRGYPYISN